MAFAITGTADQIAELLCGPRQHDEHCKGWRWHLYVRDDAKRVAAVNDEVRKMLAERRARETHGYDPTVFQRGQMYQRDVIRKLASERIDFYRLPAEVDAGEVVRRCFYQPMSADYCADLIKASIGL